MAPPVVLLGQGLRPDLRARRRDGRRPGIRVRHELGRLLPVRRQRVRQPARRRGRLRVLPRGRVPGLLLFGGNRLGPRLWLFAIVMVVLGAHFSALWIIMANSWMQTPAGYTIATDPAPARAVMTDFWQVVFTPSFWPRLIHVFDRLVDRRRRADDERQRLLLLKKQHLELARPNLKVALAAFILFATANILIFGPEPGHRGHEQPAAQAGVDGGAVREHVLRPAVPRGLGGRDEPDDDRCLDPVPAQRPRLLNPQATVQGINSFAPDPTPPINLVFQVYHFMFGFGSLFVPDRAARRPAVLAKATAARPRGGCSGSSWSRCSSSRQRSSRAGGRPRSGASHGSSTTCSRQPTGSRRRSAASTSQSRSGMFIALYAILLALFLFLLNRAIQHGPEPLEDVETVDRSSLPDTFREIFTRRARAGSSGEP